MRTITGVLAATLLLGGVALAVDDPDELMTGTSTTIKNGKLAKFSGKPTSATRDLLLPTSTNAPTSGGGSLQIFDTGKIGNEDTYNLPSGGWSRIPKNTSKLLKGFKYKGAGTSSDPCKSITLKGNVVKASCKGSGVQLTTPFVGNVGIILTVGPDSKRYCAVFGGSGKNEPAPKGLKRKGASRPNQCAQPLRPTTTTVQPTTTSTFLVVTTSTSSTSSTSTPEGSTTTTSAPEGSTTSTSTSIPGESTTSTSTSIPGESTTSTSTSIPGESTTSTSTSIPGESTTSTSTSIPGESTTSTSTSIPGESTTSTSTTTPESTTTTSTIGQQCCNGQNFVSFSTVTAPGDCGDIIAAAGTVVANIECAGLYTGGGGNSVPLPFAVPDLGLAISAITDCDGQTAILGGSNSDETGSNRNCTSTGCLFGAPLAVPNSMTPPTSVCVLNTASAPLTGTAVCDTGVTEADLPLSSNIFLTGDRQAGVGGIQPCPLCQTIGDPNSPLSGTCAGGPNNGMACIAGTTAINASYPTSHDCPPDGSDSIGSLPVAFSLKSGTISWTGTPATNDSGSTASNPTRVFSGFCADIALPGGTKAFKEPAQQCWENGMAVGAPCSVADSFESCEQRTQGAFGPNGGGNRTIVAIGSATSILAGPAPGTLVSIFSIPPTFDATIDSAGDLPGPGAVALPGTATLCSSANPCPEP